jgi:hypothetical protein
MSLQYDRFGALNEKLFWSVVNFIKAKAGDRPIDGLPVHSGGLNEHSFAPNNELFAKLRGIHYQYYKQFINYAESIVPVGVSNYSNTQLTNIINKVLVHEKLNTAGWSAVSNSNTNFISIARRKKQILVGSDGLSFSRQRMIGLLIHEVAIHAKWAEYYPVNHEVGLEEGVGTLTEQLQLKEYHPLRLYRFLAIYLAAGIDGRARNIREVYQLLLNIRKALKPNENEDKSKLFVAKEVARVYRNLPLDKPGLVYIRDKQYLEYNAVIWDRLHASVPSLSDYEKLVSPWRSKS